jgi:hypothetical protein
MHTEVNCDYVHDMCLLVLHLMVLLNLVTISQK